MGKTVTCYYPKQPMSIKVDELSEKPAERTAAFCHMPGGKSVAEHFATHHQLPLRYPDWPCVVSVGGQVNKKKAMYGQKKEKHRSYYPVEMMFIKRGN